MGFLCKQTPFGCKTFSPSVRAEGFLLQKFEIKMRHKLKAESENTR